MLSDAQRKIFDRLIWPNAHVVVRTARFLMRDATAADDLVQETFLKAIRFIDQFDVGTDARAWLLTILRNARIDALRRTKRESRLDADVIYDDLAAVTITEPSNDSAAVSAGELLDAFGDEDIINALRKLPEELLWTLLLVEVEGLEHREVATILNVPVGTIKSRTHRARSILRSELMPLARDRRLLLPDPATGVG